MELLKRRVGPFLVCLALVAAGCTVWRQAGVGEGLRFSHQKMLHQSLECADCHTETGTSATAGMPGMDTCMECHEDLDKKAPPERRVATMFENAKFKSPAKVTVVPSEIIFSHKSHTVDHKVSCTDCHPGIRESTAVTREVRVTMKDCMACHAKSTKADIAANDCATCHEVRRKDAKPPTHLKNWVRMHGQKAKDGDQEGLNQCSMCHAQDSCNSCHRAQAPANHTAQWRQRGHGVAASIDRETCTTCHQSDTCVACHKTTAPRTHRGQWGEPTDKHCQNCHFPVSGESCAFCHQSGTPSHDKAVRTPATMIGTNCRQCHTGGAGAPMPHVDNGDDCNYCHR